MKRKVPNFQIQTVLEEFYEVVEMVVESKKENYDFEDEKNSSTFAETSTGS